MRLVSSVYTQPAEGMAYVQCVRDSKIRYVDARSESQIGDAGRIANRITILHCSHSIRHVQGEFRSKVGVYSNIERSPVGPALGSGAQPAV
jgi:hypothetical protein